MSWEDCQTFCERLNAQIAGAHTRLPTEAEWEYACRAETQSAFSDGSACILPEGNDVALRRLGWFGENSDHESYPVRQLAPNRWGLFDMHGNICEWCSDWYGAYGSEAQTDPSGPTTGLGRVVRGGSWHDFARRCRAAYRFSNEPGDRYEYFGFRVAAGQP